MINVKLGVRVGSGLVVGSWLALVSLSAFSTRIVHVRHPHIRILPVSETYTSPSRHRICLDAQANDLR